MIAEKRNFFFSFLSAGVLTPSALASETHNTLQ